MKFTRIRTETQARHVGSRSMTHAVDKARGEARRERTYISVPADPRPSPERTFKGVTGAEANSGVYVSADKALRLAAHAVRPGDILSTKMGLPPCISCVYPEWMSEGVITADIIRLRPDLGKVTSPWLSAALNWEGFRRQVQTITAGVTRPKVTLSDFRRLCLARPRLVEQRAIDDRLEGVASVLSAESAHLAKLRELKQGLMQALLTPPG